MSRLIEETGRDAVIRYLKLISNDIEKQDEVTIHSFYSIASNDLQTEEEKTALKYGTLSVLAIVGNKKIRSFVYQRRFIKAMKQLD